MLVKRKLGHVTPAVVDSVEERCLQWIGGERKLTLIPTLIPNTNREKDQPLEPARSLPMLLRPIHTSCGINGVLNACVSVGSSCGIFPTISTNP